MRRNSDNRLRELERKVQAEPSNPDATIRLAGEYRRLGREGDALAAEIRLRIASKQLTKGVARVLATFPPGLQGRLPEAESILGALRSVVKPFDASYINSPSVTSVGLDEGWIIFDAGDRNPPYPRYMIEVLHDDEAGDRLINDYAEATGNPEHDDRAAWWRVREKAYAGSMKHVLALAFLLLNATEEEYQAVLSNQNRWTPGYQLSEIEWPERERRLVRYLVLGDEPFDPENVLVGSIRCSKCLDRGMPSGEKCSECGEPFCWRCDGANHPGEHRCEGEDEEEEVVENPRRSLNPLVDSDILAQRLVDAGFGATELPLSEVNLSTADRGHPVVDEPERYRWFLIHKFPVNAFGLKLEDLVRDSSDPGHEKWRHDKIVALLREEPAWPAIVAADGVLVDGFHRIAANRTLKRKTMPVVVAVERSGQSYWDEDWLNSDTAVENPGYAASSEIDSWAKHAANIREVERLVGVQLGPQIACGSRGCAFRVVGSNDVLKITPSKSETRLAAALAGPRFAWFLPRFAFAKVWPHATGPSGVILREDLRDVSLSPADDRAFHLFMLLLLNMPYVNLDLAVEQARRRGLRLTPIMLEAARAAIALVEWAAANDIYVNRDELMNVANFGITHDGRIIVRDLGEVSASRVRLDALASRVGGAI